MARAAKCQDLLFWNSCLHVVVVAGWQTVSLFPALARSVRQGKHPSLGQEWVLQAIIKAKSIGTQNNLGNSDSCKSFLDDRMRASEGTGLVVVGGVVDGDGPREGRDQAGWTSGREGVTAGQRVAEP